MAYCMYLRKSRADAEAESRGEGETLARHKQTLGALAARMGISVSQVYEEIVSGETISSRPAVQALLHAVNAGAWEGVLCMEVERLARGDTIDQGIVAQAFKFSGTKIITPNKTYDPQNEFDEEYFEFSLFMSRREYKVINRRMQAGRLASVREGNYIGSQPPFGYRKQRDYEKGVFTLEPIPAEAELVQLMYAWYTSEQIGASKIATRLNSMGCKPRRASVWSASSVTDILHNPVYIGKNRWNWRQVRRHIENGKIVKSRPKNADADCCIYQALHPAIVSPALWNAAQARKQTVRYNGSLKKPQQNPFAGILYCGFCGHAMSRQPGKHGATLLCRHSGCPCVGVGLEKLERCIRDVIVEAYGTLALRQSNATNETEPDTKTVSRMEKELAKCIAQRERLCELLETGVYSPEIFFARTKQLDDRQASLSAQLNAQKRQSVLPSSQKNHTTLLRDVLTHHYFSASPAARSALLQSLISRIVYRKTVPERRGLATDLQLDIFFRL